MNVAFFIRNQLTIYGGFEKVLSILLDYLRLMGVDVSIYVLFEDGKEVPNNGQIVQPYRNGFKTIRFKYKYDSFLKRASSFFGQIQIEFLLPNDIESEALFRDLNVAIIIEPIILAPLSIFLKEHGFTGKVVGWFHSNIYLSSSRLMYFFKRTFQKNTLRKGFKNADFFLCISTGLAKQLTKLSVPSNKVAVVYNPVLSDKDFDPIKRSKETIFAYIGRIDDKIKNLKFLLRGLSKLEFDWKLKIFGKGPDENMLSKYAENLKISDKIEWLGFCANPYDVLKKDGVTAVVLTSRFEGLPTVLIEAVAHSIPVVSSNCNTGPDDIVISGVNGYLYKQGSIKDFTEKIKKISFETHETQNFTELGKFMHSVDKFRIESVCENIYKKLFEIYNN